jgi:DNA-binding MarR family transcriptional regulator
MKMNNIISLNSRIREYVHVFISKELNKAGHGTLAPSHGDILAALLFKGELTKTEISKKINRDRSTVTTLIKKLEKLGYVATKINEHDSRSTLVYLTEKGKMMKNDFMDISSKLYNLAHKGMTEEEIATLQELIDKMYQNFKEESRNW